MIELFVQIFPSLSAAICLIGFLLALSRLRKLSSVASVQRNTDADPMPGIVAGLTSELASLNARVNQWESSPRESSGVALRNGMNLNQRSQALRHHRLGQSAGDIAKALDMPKAEVDLLLKVHRLVSR